MPKKRLVQTVVVIVHLLMSFFLCKPEYYIKHLKENQEQKTNIVIVGTPNSSEQGTVMSVDPGN